MTLIKQSCTHICQLRAVICPKWHPHTIKLKCAMSMQHCSIIHHISKLHDVPDVCAIQCLGLFPGSERGSATTVLP